MANVIGEVRATTTGNTHKEVEKVYLTTLKKDTIRGVDYRKATINFCLAMRLTKYVQK